MHRSFQVTGQELDLFRISGKQESLIEFSNKRIKGFNNDLSHILIILMEISSQPWALFTFKALIIFIISSSLKSKELSLDWVKNI